MMANCPHLMEVEEWAREGCDVELSERLAEHAKDCASCGSFIEEVRETRELTASLPVHTMSSRRHDSIRFELMAAARSREPEKPQREVPSWNRRRVFAVFAAAASVAAVAVGAVVLRPRDDDAANLSPLARVTLAEGATGETVSTNPDEIYRLVRGVAEFDVRSLAQGERFRVLAGDGVVEVRGTRFRVEVREGQMTEVRVSEGHVLVDVADRRVASLMAGEQWARSGNLEVATAQDMTVDDEPSPDLSGAIAAAPSSIAPSGSRHSSHQSALPPRPVFVEQTNERDPVVEPHVQRDAPVEDEATQTEDEATRTDDEATQTEDEATQTDEATQDEATQTDEAHGESDTAPVQRERTEGDAAFAQAWQLLRSGRTREAARAFDALWAGDSLDTERRADVLYWSAEAYRRAGDRSAAESRASMLLRETPGAWRAPEANLIVGESALQRGDIEAARTALERAARSGRQGVSVRAQRALERLESR